MIEEKYERTTRDYPTFGPSDGTGRDWNAYFRDLKGRDDVVDHEPDHDDDSDLPGAIEVTVPAHEVGSGWPRAIGTWRTRCLAAGWAVKVGRSVAHHADAYHKNGNLKKAEQDVECWWINAVRDGLYITISYYIRDGKPEGGWTARTERSNWLKKYSDAEMQALIKGVEDDTDPGN